MKKQYIAAFACILAAACSKAELNEVNPGPSGESMTLTLPHTKVAVSGDSYQFELDDEITAIASNGSRATLKPNAASSGAQTATNYFTGTFDKPVADGSTISFYYNAKSIADNGTATFEQNGDPWLVSTGNNFTRTEDRQISVTATLAAPENVRAIAVIFTDSEGIDSFEFHAKDQNIKLGTFDGTSFSGNSTVSQNVLNHQSEGIKFMRSNIVYVPKDMEGGFWIKAVKGQQAMYKSYATKNPIENTTVTISSFVPAKVDIDVQISGFATSYSYYVANEGIEGISAKDVNKANSVSNDWMGEGKAVCTITKSGIPSTLLSVKSVSMLVNGEEYSKDYTDNGNNTFTLHKTAHTKWEQKNVSVKVVYSTPDGLEFEGTSNTLTRHITGLPYKMEKETTPKDWILNNNGKGEGYLIMKSGDAFSISPRFIFPSKLNVSATLKAYAYGGSLPRNYKPTVSIGASEDASKSQVLATLQGSRLTPGTASYSNITNNQLSLTQEIRRICIYTQGETTKGSAAFIDMGVVCKSFKVEYR